MNPDRDEVPGSIRAAGRMIASAIVIAGGGITLGVSHGGDGEVVGAVLIVLGAVFFLFAYFVF